MGLVEVFAPARAGRPHVAACRSLLRKLLRATGSAGAGVTLLLTGDKEVRRLNRLFRGRDRSTDVLSFPFSGDLEPLRPHLGDIAISVPRAMRQAKRAGWPLSSELALLVTHGFLHLLGHDHETDDGTMLRLEEALLRRWAGIDPGARSLAWGRRKAGGRGAAIRSGRGGRR